LRGWFCVGTSGSSDDDKLSARRFDGRLFRRSKLFSVGVRVRHIDFSDEINGRFALSMHPAYCRSADKSARE
jgi:hypothetical protein